MYQKDVADSGGAFLDLSKVMRDWVRETLLQGAYLREYHLWEKDCRAYFLAMAAQWGASLRQNAKRQSFPILMREWLADFGLEYPAQTFDAISSNV